MASGGADEEDEGISLDIDDVHMLLHALRMDCPKVYHLTGVEQEQIQKRTFTNWINAQLAKRSPTSHVSDLFSDLRDGSVLLDLLEVITGRPMKRQKGHGVFQQRADIETALDFLRKKSIKLVNINIPDIIDGNPSIILGLIWTIILHCHIEEMTSSLSNSIPHSSLDSLDSVESSSSTPPSASPVPPGQRSLHKSFGLSAKKALLTWAQDQCQRVGCPVSIKDFKSSWQSGEAFLAILCSLRPQLVDLSRVRSRSHLENLQEAFELAERELHIPHLLEPQDVDVPDPDEKSIMTFVAQFLQFSIDLSSPNAHEKEPVLPSAAFKDDNRPTSPTSLHQGNKQHKTSSEGQTEAKKAKSQLEKTRIRLQARIQQATKLFSSKEISEAEAKRKERALRALKPALLEDFLAAVECFGAFCAEPQLQDLILLSNSVRKQWEDVRTEMAAYIPMLWSKIRDRKQQVSVLSSEIYTNTLHKATDLSDHGDWHQQQVFTEGALSSEKSVQPLESSPLTTDKIPQATVMEQTADGRATLLTIDSPLRTTGMRITTSPRNKLVLNQPPVDCLQEEPSPVSPVEVSPQLFANMVPLQAQAVPPEAEDNPRPIEEHSRPEQDFVPEELPLVTCIWHDSQGKHQIQEQDSVWTRREREWSGIVGTTNPQQKLDTIREEVVLSFSEAIDPMESVDDDIMLISENINQIAITPINISSLTLTDPTLLSDLKDINNRLQAKMEQLLDHKHKTPQAISSHSDTLHSSVHHRRQYLEQVLSAVQDLDLFLATLRKVKAESSNVLVKQDDSEWQCVADREVEIQQRFESSFRQSENTDSALNAVGLRLTMDGANVTCRDVVTLLFKDIEEELTQKRNVEVIEERQQVQENRSKNVIEKMNANVFEQTEAQGCPTNSLERIKDFKLMGNEEVVKTRDEKKRRRRPSEVEVEEESLDQRRIKLLGELKELRTEAEELGLQEHTLPALHQRSRALMRLENCLSDLQSELEHIQKASQSENCDDNVNREVEDLWEATTKAVSDRLEQCHLLAELLKRFQKIRGEVGETLLRAETTVRDQASYMGREKLQRLQTKVNETKTELNNLGDRIEELRSVSRQLCTHLHKIQQCTSNIPFESEAHSLMDQWLDISERVESRVENLHLAFSLWDSALKQGLEVERWAMNKLSAFAHSPTFQTEEDIKALQDEVEAQEESMKCFQQITIDIQELLQSTEPPLELQVVEPQMRRKMDELKELVSEAEDVYRQTEAAKTNVTDRMTASFSSLHNIYESLLSLRGPDPAAVLAKLKDLCFQLQDQDEQVQSLQEDLQVLASVARPESLQSLFDNGQKLQDGIRTVHQLFSAVEERMQRDIQVYDRLQQEQEHLKQWLNNAEYKVSEDLSVLQEEVLNQRVRTEALSQLLLLLRNSTFQQTELIEDSGKLLERYNSFETGVQGGLGEKQNREKLSESLSTQTCVKEVKQPDAPISENCGVRRGLCAESSAAKDRQTCATGSIDDLKHEVQESEKEMQGEDVPQTLQPGQIDLQTSDHPSSASTFSQSFMSSVPSLTDDMRKDRILKDSHWFELETCLSLLKAQLDDVSSPGEAVCNEERFSRLLQDCCHELTSLQGKMSDCQDENTATPSSYSALEVLLQQLADIDKDLSQLVAPMDLTSSLSQQINNLLNHKRALHNSIRERMAHDKKQSNQQVEEDAVNGVSKDTDRSILEPKHRDCAENALRETGVTQVKSQLQQRRQTEYMGPPAPSPLSFGLDETILDHKEDDIFSSLSAFQHKITDVVPSHCQPFHCPQNDSTIVIKGSFISEEKPPAWFLPVTETSGETNVIENGPNQRPQGETLVPCPGDIQITNAIVQDSNTEIIVTSPSYSGDSEIYAKCQASAKEATAQDFKQKDDTDFCQLEELMMGRVLRTVEGEDLTNKKLSMAAEDTHAYPVEMEEEDGNVDQANDTESKEKQCLDSIALLLKKVCKLEFPPSSEDTEMTPGQITLDMEPERTHGSDAHRGAGEATGGSYKHKFTMRDILAGVQSLVESSTIINRAPRLDLNWFLKSSPSEAEIHLIRTVQRVFVCRYQPAQLSLTAMTRQLQDAENYRCCVQEQVAAIKSTGKSDIPKSLEGLCSAALLDASATVQVKEAQLEQVKQYHRQVKMIKTFLEVVAAERDKMSLDILGSSELQAVQLHALLKTMDQKRCLINELVKLSGQLSVHLSNTESLGALVARLGDVQEEWRLLEGCIKTDLQHASNSASQLSAFRQESNALKERLENLIISLQSFTTVTNFKNTTDLLILTADLKLCSQLYGHLHSQFDALAQFSTGQKEKDDLKKDLEELASLLSVTKMKLETLTNSCGGISSIKINKQLQDLIIWAKQAENHITTGKKLALFPKEACIQIAEMEKFQTDIICRRSEIQKCQYIDTVGNKEDDEVVKATEDLYETISSNVCQCLQTMKDNLKERETLLGQLASMDAWLAELHNRDTFGHVENVHQVDITNLEKQLNAHKGAAIGIESQLKMVESVAESCKKISVGLSPGESRYLVNRLSGIRTEIDGLLAHEKAIIWELEELFYQWTTCDEELTSIETSLEQISNTLKKQRFPLTQESISEVGLLKHMLTEHQCQVQEMQYCKETKRSSVLDAIGELQDKCNVLSLNAIEQDKYLQLKRQMDDSRDIVNKQIMCAKDKEASLGERFRLCQNVLVELPLVKTQCQEVADQLEAIAQELYPSELNTERQRIRRSVETLVAWEHAITDDIRNLESKLLLGLRFETELPALMELLQKTKQELEKIQPVEPDEKAVDVRLQTYWLMWRNMESGMRVLDTLARKEKKNIRNYEELYSLRNEAMKECLTQMESLSHARESLKDYQWAAQGAIGFLHNAEATFLSSTGGFLDCTEEQSQLHQALEALEAGFQAHVDHLMKLVPQQPCLSRAQTEELHIQIFSQLLVGRAVLEAEAQFRLEALQRCSERQQTHRRCHEDALQCLSGFEEDLAKCAAEHVSSYEKCVARQKRAKLLAEDLQRSAGQIEELRAGCPMQGCGAGRGGEVGALWRGWAALRRGVGLLLAHTEQRAEEWKDISTSMKQCCSSLASLQTELPESSSGAGEGSLELVAQAELHQAGLEQEQRALVSLEHCLEHALSLSHSQGPTSPRPIGKTLVDIKENVRSLKERNQLELMVEAPQEKEKEKQQVIDELTELERHVLGLCPVLESCSRQSQQEYKKELSSHKAKLQHITDSVQSCYSEIPADICKHLQEVQVSLQRAEEKITKRSAHVERLAGQVEELSLGLERVKDLLKQKSSSVTEAQNALKRVWDQLDMWHGRLMLLESEVQDLAEDLPDQAHLLMDQLTEPLQCYQNTAQMVEHHTAYLSKIPACLREYEDILYRATCWLDEAESWLGASCSFTTARSLQNHANSLQLLLEDSERIRRVLMEFRPVLSDISAVCEISVQAKNLEDADRNVLTMQQTILQPLGSLLQAATVVEDLEAELRNIERDVSKIEVILSSEDNGNISLPEHLHNRQVILSNAQSMKQILRDMQRCKEELNLPWDGEERKNLVVFSKASSLLQHIEELEQLCQKQASVLENNIRKMEGIPTSKKPGDRKQEAFVVSSSEEDEDEEDECCHSSSSDTLTSSIPEDPDETIRAADLQRDEAEQLANVKGVDGLPSALDTSLGTTESWLLSVRPWLDTSASENMESDLETLNQEPGSEETDAGDSLSHKNVTPELPIFADVSTVAKPTSVGLKRSGSQRQEDFVISSSQVKAGLEDTRLVPVRPITPFAAAAVFEEEDEHLSLLASPSQELDTLNQLKEHNENEIRLEEKHKQTLNCPKKLVRLNLQEEQPLWSQLTNQVSQKLSSLEKLQQDFQLTKGETVATGSTYAVLQQTQQAVLMLTPIVSSDGPGEQRDLFEALRQVLVSLDALTDLLLTPLTADDGVSEIKLLQNECVTGELVALTALLDQIQTVDNPDVSQCVTCLQQCLGTVQNQLQSQIGLTQQQQVVSDRLCFMDDLDLKQDRMFQCSAKAPNLKCVLVQHLRECPGERAELQQASQSLLQGISRLVELGEECTAEGQKHGVHSRSELQAALQRPERLLQVLTSQLAFAHYLFQQVALKCHEDEWVQLQVRAKALQQQALDQQVTSQRRLQEWTLWEDNCGQLGRLLDECETFLGSEEPKGSDTEELGVQRRKDGCQQILTQLDESRCTLGLFLDRGENLQAGSVRQTGGALELRWRNIYRQTEQEMKRYRDMQENWASFQTEAASLSQWLIGAKKQVQTCSDLAATSDLKQECVHSSLIKLLNFSVEFGSMSVQKVCLSRKASQLLRLREADCPGLRDQLTSLEAQWNQLTSDLSNTQEQLQQHLLKRWPPDNLLSALEDWLKTLQTQLNIEKEEIIKAKDSAYLSGCLQHFKGLKVGLTHGQLLLDFLCQSGPHLVGEDAIILRSERTMMAEKLGSLRLRWVDLQGELENQIYEAEHMHHICAQRERKLQHLRNLIDQQTKRLDQWKRPYSDFLAQRLLREWEGHLESLKDMAAVVEELKATHLNAEIPKHKSNFCFTEEVERLSRASEDLFQQMEILKPALQQTTEKWSCLKSDLNEICLYTVRLHCSLQQLRAPVFSLQQAESHLHCLQELLLTAANTEDLWDILDKSCQSLLKSIDPAMAQALNEQKERERERWKGVLQDLKVELRETEEIISTWQEFTDLSKNCSLQLQQVWSQWEKLLQMPQTHEDIQSRIHSVEELQKTVENVKQHLEDVLAASKPLNGRLDSVAYNIVQSENSQLSRDVLILSKSLEGYKKSLQEDTEKHNLLHVHLESLENQTKDIEKMDIRIKDMDSAKQVFRELSYLFSSLIDVSEASAHVNLSNHDSERLHVLRGRYMENITHSFDLYKQLHFKHHLSLDFEGKGKALADIQETLARESSLGKPVNYNSLKLMSAVHQRLQGDIVIGHKLLHGLLCDAVKVMENASDEKRSETLAQVSCIKQGWFDVLTTVNQRRSLVKQQLSRYTLYRCGLEHLCNLLRDLDPLLFSTGPVICVSQICTRDYECIEEALQAHSAVYTGTVDAGRTLCESMTNFECQKQLQTELQGLEEAWERATSLVGRQKATVQKWSQCQERIADLRSELDQCGLKLKRGPAVPKEDTEEIVQETELSLQRLRSGGQREVVSMKMDLSQYVPAGDSALLEQQLEQLHSQWEELCMKVSLRRQEIADRLNAWTIFNDKNKEFCDWLSQMENKVCHSGDLSFEEMVEKLKKDCMEEINLFSENKSHLKQLGEQLLLASDEAKQSQVHGSLQEVNQRWHNLFHHIEARVKKLKETLATVQQLDKNMSNLRSWLCRIEAELSRPITYSVLHHHEIQKRLAEHQELQRDIEQHTEGVASVLNLCDVLLRDEDASNGTEVNSDSLQETSHSLDQRWRTICALALDRRLRIEETWRLWCKFLDDYSRFEDWLKMAEQTAANPNTGDVLYTVAKEELKKFEGFQRQVHERLTQLEIVNNQYRRLARENRTDRASQLKAMVHEGNRRWDTLHRRVAAILRRLKYFTSQREDFESTRESMLVWLTELDLQLTNVEHFSESDVHHKIQQLSSFQKEITVNTERIDGLIVFGEGLIQRSSPQDAALIEEELEELHSYCQEVFGRLVRFHQRLSQPPIPVQLQIPEVSTSGFSLESSLELIGRPWLGRSLSSLPATPTHLLTSPLSRSGRETPVSVDSLPLEWDHTGDVGGSSSHEDDEDEDLDDEGAYFSAVSSRSVCDSPRWRTQDDSELVDLEPDCHAEAPPTLASTPLKQGNYLHLMSQCSGSIEDFKRVSLILDDEESPDEFGLTGLNSSGRQSGVIERWELLQAQSQTDLRDDPKEQLTCDLDNISSWLDTVIPELHRVQTSDSANTVEEMTARAKELKEMHKMFSHYKSTMLSLNLRLQGDPDSQQKLAEVNRSWSRACTELQQWDTTLRQTLMRCQEFHETLHSLLLWLAHAESRRYAVDIAQPKTTIKALKQHRNTLSDVREELLRRQTQQASLHALWSQLRPEHTEDSDEAQEKLHVTGSKMKILLREVTEDLRAIQQRLEFEPTSDEQDQSKSTVPSEEEVHAKKILPNLRGERRDSAQPRSFFYRLLRAAFPLQLLLLLLLLFPCLVPMSHSEHSCTVANNFARSFYPMLHYTNGPPPT